jgi:predicted TIM-barrel fold metal-dependent hydrolase
VSEVVDSLVFCGEHRSGWRHDPDAILAVGEHAGIDRHVLVTPLPFSRLLEPENERIASIAASDPARFDGLARIDPLAGEGAARAAEDSLDDLGLAGIFLHPGEEGFTLDDPRVDVVVGVAAARRAPVVVSTGIPWSSEALQVAALAGRHPGAPFVLTNGGQINISGLGMQDAAAALDSAPNIVIQTNGEYRQDFIEDVATRLGPERVLFASGSPQFEPAFEVLRCRWADLPREAIDLMLGGSWARLRAARTS